MEMNGVRRLENGQVSADGHKTGAAAQGACRPAFGELLQDRAKEGLNFSKHAAKRMNEREIAVDTQLMSDLEHAVEEARKKGARDVAVIGCFYRQCSQQYSRYDYVPERHERAGFYKY